MIRLIAWNEWTLMSRSRQVQIAAVLISLLTAGALWAGAAYHQRVRGEHEAARQLARAQWESQGDKNPHSAAHFGTYAFKPVYALSLFDNGLDKYLGVSVFLEAHQQHQAQNRLIEYSNSMIRFGELTPAFILIYLLPLIIMLGGFAAFSGEREQGILRLALSQGVQGRVLALGKAAGLWMITLACLVPLLGLGALALAFQQPQQEEWLRYALLCAVYTLYAGIWVHLTLAASAWARKPHTALVGLLGFWLLSSLIAPRLLAQTAAAIEPPPSALAYRESLEQRLEEGIDGHDPFNIYSKALETKVLAEYGVKSVEELPFNYDGYLMQQGEIHEKVVYDAHMDSLQALYRRQLRIQLAGAPLSPADAMRQLSMALARTSLESHHHFIQAANDYRVTLVGELNADLQYNSSYGDWSYEAGEALFRSNVRFDYQPLRLSEHTAELAGPACILLVWFAASFGLLMLSTRSLQP